MQMSFKRNSAWDSIGTHDRKLAKCIEAKYKTIWGSSLFTRDSRMHADGNRSRRTRDRSRRCRQSTIENYERRWAPSPDRKSVVFRSRCARSAVESNRRRGELPLARVFHLPCEIWWQYRWQRSPTFAVRIYRCHCWTIALIDLHLRRDWKQTALKGSAISTGFLLTLSSYLN